MCTLHAVEREKERLVGESLQLKSDAASTFTYDSNFKLCDNGTIELKLYYDSINCRIDGFEDVNPEDHFRTGRKESRDSGVIRSDSLTRTREKLIDYACMHESDWKSFITLTLKDETIDINTANNYFRAFINSWRKKYPDLMYLGVPEFQKRGAVHYHLLTNVECGSYLIPQREVKKLWNPESKKFSELKYYNLKHWDSDTLGYSSAFDFKITDDKFNVALYITKYLYKDISNRLFGHNKILKSNNLLKPDVIKLRYSSSAYNNAMEYLNEKGYLTSAKSIIGDKPYQVPYDIINAKLSRDDYNIVSALLKDDLPF